MGVQEMIGLAVIAGGCTWALARAIGKVESAFAAHMASDAEIHKDHGARILKLESPRRGRK